MQKDINITKINKLNNKPETLTKKIKVIIFFYKQL